MPPSPTSLLSGLTAPLAHGAAARRREHRPWPVPRRPWVMAQTWVDLLFAHWRVEPADLAASIPSALELDTHGGAAWVGVTPFRVCHLRPRGGLPVPFVSTFPEVNCRTYVTVGGKAGIFFFSLDAGSRLAVAAARRLYRLPYFRAQATMRREGETIIYDARRCAREEAPAAELCVRYGPRLHAFQARPGTLEHWLTERYCLYTLDGQGRPLRGEIHHPPWKLYEAWAHIERNAMGSELGLALDGAPLLHYAPRQDVVFWPLRRA